MSQCATVAKCTPHAGDHWYVCSMYISELFGIVAGLAPNLSLLHSFDIIQQTTLSVDERFIHHTQGHDHRPLPLTSFGLQPHTVVNKQTSTTLNPDVNFLMSWSSNKTKHVQS